MRKAKNDIISKLCFSGFLLFSFLKADLGFSYRANKVHFHSLQNGIYRVTIEYTVPELLQFREAYVEFRSLSKAKNFYWDAVRGVDFYWLDPENRTYIQNPKQTDPW